MNDLDPTISDISPIDYSLLTGGQRVVIACRMFGAYRAKILASFPPGLSEADRKVMLFERLYGDDFDENRKKEIIAYLISHSKSKA
jgi:hypothetical protein